MDEPLNLYYEEPDADRLVPGDRYFRRIVRSLVRGAPRPGGQKMVFINLCLGLDQLGVPYRINDFRRAKNNPEIPVGIIGKSNVLYRQKWRNPILFGASVMSHPLADPGLLDRLPIQRVLVPGEWMRSMCEPYWGDRVRAWPVGIDTDRWAPNSGSAPDIDVLLYDKIRWKHDYYDAELLQPIRERLNSQNLRVVSIRYGHYLEEDFEALLRRCRSMIFLCEHETQGLAYQQALSCGVPIFAWNRSGYWQDPEFYPDRVKYAPVTSVPYWDDRCGTTFTGRQDFDQGFDRFWSDVEDDHYRPREFILDNLTLKKCARLYVEQWREAFAVQVPLLNA
jgi:hypothetical protein